MNELSAVRICVSKLSQDDIAKTKMFFEHYNKGGQMVSLGRDGTQKTAQELISLGKEVKPSFVAKDKLPPGTFDHLDITSLLKEIVCLKKSLVDVTLRLNASEEIIRKLRKEVDSLRDSRNVSSSPNDATNINTRRGARLDESAFLPPTLTSSAVVLPQVTSRPAPPVLSSRAPTSLPVKVMPTKSSLQPQRRDFASVVTSKPTASEQRGVPKPALNINPKCAATGNRDDDGFVVVQKKKNTKRVNGNHCGTGPNILLRAGTPTTAILLPCLHYSTKEKDIVNYIKFKSNLTVRVKPQLKKSYNDTSKAFVVLVPKNMLPTFIKEDYWPRGVEYRRYRGRLP
ncbi:uncharacterized protein LOC131854492 [Achroia grisella]|uniref:uncharacterized protein LOC131854492 n=1 Tax=Achroia grisella TaxID=688607 RepID=UPI0027D1FDD5|nr:uncharacterized protein LOC131854492 [Achroia grisella]